MGDDFRIFFVKEQDNGENQTALLEAFELLSAADHGFNPQWISQEECLSIEETSGKQNSKIFIFNRFDGAGFEHIKGLGYRIYGPRCILSNLQNGLVLPRDKKRPIFNLAMKGIKICCTSIDKASREKMQRLVHLMAGEIGGDLTEDVTHLVAGEVGSNKYMVALANKKIVLTKEWVTDVWESSQNKHIMATDEIFNKFKCPCFLGLTVVVSGFNSSERNQIKNFVLKGGGKYSGELKMNECTHLIVKEAKGAKYEAAKNWKIKIVQDKWLYECMDKGRYLDTKPYEFKKEDKKAKTSTPERLSVAGPHITDVSVISCAGPDYSMRVSNEAEMPSSIFSDQCSFSGKTVAESRLGMTGVDIDVTVAPADIFLDGCKIFLSGVQPSVQEKMKKIITSCGGFRATEITEGITHVIFGEIIAADLSAISKLVESPHLVSSDWLMDCFAQNVRVAEKNYLRSDLDGKQNEKKARVPPKFSDDNGQTSEKKQRDPEGTSTATDDKKNDISVSENKHPVGMEEDVKMDDLLSQYTLADENEETLCKSKNDKNDDGDIEILGIETGKQMENNLEMTQDPNDYNETSNAGMFHKKTFQFFGLDDGDAEEAVKELEEFIESQGGCVVRLGKRHQIVDIAIVPLTGFPVDITVSEVLTVVWLQMCLENEVLVPYNHWLSRPIELPKEDVLNELCICVSGYIGIERNSIMHLAQALGAMCQDHFARCPTKKVKASTHLIVNAPGGSKYTAAKKWKIPAVGKEWLVACIKSNKKVCEDDFDIDIIDAKQLEEEKSDMSLTHLEANNDTIPGHKENDSNGNGQQDKNDIYQQQHSSVLETGDKSSDTSEELPSIRALPSEETASATVEPTGAKENIQAPSVENPQGNHIDLTTDERIGVTDSAKKSACKPNQTDNINAAYSTNTPATTPMDRRRKKLVLQGVIDSPSSTSTPIGLIKGGGETPGTFQHPDFRPKFNTERIFGVETPQTTRDLNTSTPLGDVFSRQITKAAVNAANLYPDDEMTGTQSQQTELPPLHGVIIAVAKKLGRNHATYNGSVVELGGDYSWQYNDSVTHFVFQGRLNDTNKEFRRARDDGKIIVSPHWLTVCHEQGCRVDESLFPHHYNPSQALAMVSSKETPSKSARATRNRGIQGETPSKPLNIKTPRKMPVLNIQEVLTKKAETTPSSRKGSHSKNETTTSCGSEENTSPCSPGRKDTTASDKSSASVAQDSKIKPQTKSPDQAPPTTNERIPSVDGNVAGPIEGNKTAESKSQEMKDALAQTLGSVLEEASRSKKTRKNKGRLAKLSGQLNASGGKTPENTTRTITPGSRSAKEAEKDVNQFPEFSQSLQVTWDDPTERLEKEKLAHRLERVCDPSQNTDDYLAGLDLPSVSEGPNSTIAANDRSPTPEAPSIAFPVPRPMPGVSSPQPVDILSDESNDGRLAINNIKQTPSFLFSGMQEQERVEYGALVEQLGGKVVEKQHFDPACTHLVVSQPVRNEKYLSCIAAGKWVLHKSYLEACRREGKLVSEEAHEWGSPHTLSIMQNMTAQAFKLASAAHKWRKKVASLKKGNASCGGAFDGWNVMLCLGRHKEDNFKRLLEAGGAEVVSMRPPFPDSLKVTHAFLDLNKVEVPQDDLALLISLGMHCVSAEYIAAYLTDDFLPDPCDFCPTEIVALKASRPELSSSRKRRAVSDDDNGGGTRKMSRI